MPNEWLASPAEFSVAEGSGGGGWVARCHHNRSFLKRAETPSGSLPKGERLAVPVGTRIALSGAPRHADGYLLLACAPGTLCGVRAAGAPPPRQYWMVGDSISLGLQPEAARRLRPLGWTTTHSPGNAGNANRIAHSLDCWLAGAPRAPDVITVNAGIHDLARGQEWLPEAAYAELMGRSVQRLVGTGAHVLVVATTPVPTNATHPDQPACPEGILDSEVRAYNAVAQRAAAAAGAGWLDLHRVVTDACGGVGYAQCRLQRPGNPHFLDAGWAVLGEAVARAVGGYAGRLRRRPSPP